MIDLEIEPQSEYYIGARGKSSCFLFNNQIKK
nr:MAG TPA: hypothetical protein [Caudoviricetes sp.]